MTFTHDVSIWSIRTNSGRRKSYEFRWKTEIEPHSKSFLTLALADSFRSDLLQASKRGELFDVKTGLPRSMLREKMEAYAELAWKF